MNAHHLNCGILHALTELRRLVREHGREIEMFGYHDFTEFPQGVFPTEATAKS